VTNTDWAAGSQGTGHYAEVNGINLYFETHGAGQPLILPHGGLGSGAVFGPVLPAQKPCRSPGPAPRLLATGDRDGGDDAYERCLQLT